MFRDECEIEVRAGKGGDGLVSFRRERSAPKGGPDGGNGGDGGDIVLCATSRVNSLLSVARWPIYRARNGQPGGSRDCSGRGADPVRIEVPIGTQILDRHRGNLLRDLCEEGQELVIARGGSGGRGNAMFATAIRQVPRRAELGRVGEHRELRLELKLFAEVGLIGLPNAGKSTLLSRVTAATPRIADYPFTTLSPQVGIAAVGDYDTLVLADLPGLIEGAAEGAGLGHQFLKHVERCRVLLHLVDVSETAVDAPLDALTTIEGELERYSAELAGRPRLVVATKCEDDAARRRAEELAEATGGRVRLISSVTGEGLDSLLEEARKLVRGTDFDL
jgi:GTPase